VVVYHHDLSDRPGILELQDGFLLYSEHDHVLSAYADLGGWTEWEGRGDGISRKRTAQVPFFTASMAYST